MKLGVRNVLDGVQVVQLEPAMQMTHNETRHAEAETSNQNGTLHAVEKKCQRCPGTQINIYPEDLLKKKKTQISLRLLINASGM